MTAASWSRGDANEQLAHVAREVAEHARRQEVLDVGCPASERVVEDAAVGRDGVHEHARIAARAAWDGVLAVGADCARLAEEEEDESQEDPALA